MPVMIGMAPTQTAASVLSTNPDDPPISRLLPTHRYRWPAWPNNVAIVTSSVPSHQFAKLATLKRSPSMIKQNSRAFPIGALNCRIFFQHQKVLAVMPFSITALECFIAKRHPTRGNRRPNLIGL